MVPEKLLPYIIEKTNVTYPALLKWVKTRLQMVSGPRGGQGNTRFTRAAYLAY